MPPAHTNNRKCIVICWGNDLRGDDAAGHHVAEALAATHRAGVDVVHCHQLVPELAEDIATASRVVFVDAYAAGANAPLRVEHVSAAHATHALGHHADPHALLQMVLDLYGTAPEAWLFGIPAFHFDIGRAISAPTAERIHEAVERIEELLPA